MILISPPRTDKLQSVLESVAVDHRVPALLGLDGPVPVRERDETGMMLVLLGDTSPLGDAPPNGIRAVIAVGPESRGARWARKARLPLAVADSPSTALEKANQTKTPLVTLVIHDGCIDQFSRHARYPRFWFAEVQDDADY